MIRNLLILILVLVVTAQSALGGCKKPITPEMPSDSADAEEMDRAGRDVNQYMKEMKKYRDCEMKIINDADNDLAAVIETWNRAVDLFKQKNQDHDN